MSDVVLRHLPCKRSLNPHRNPVALFLFQRKEIGSETLTDLARFACLLPLVRLVPIPLPETNKLSGNEDNSALLNQISKTAWGAFPHMSSCSTEMDPGPPLRLDACFLFSPMCAACILRSIPQLALFKTP